MEQPLQKVNKKFPIIWIVAITLIGILLFYLGWVAVQLQVNPFDAYSIYLNARGIATGNAVPYYWKRAPFLPIILSPIFFIEKHFHISSFGVVASRLLDVIFFALLLWVAYKIFCLYAKKITALLGVFLLATNRLLVHFAPFSKEDIPGALFTAAAFYFYILSSQKKTESALCFNQPVYCRGLYNTL